MRERMRVKNTGRAMDDGSTCASCLLRVLSEFFASFASLRWRPSYEVRGTRCAVRALSDLVPWWGAAGFGGKVIVDFGFWVLDWSEP